MNKHKILLVGCGEMSNIWLDYVDTRDNAEIVALVDINLSSAEKMLERRNLNVPIFNNLLEGLKTVNPNLVFDITIPSSHENVVITALESGCHVFGEKPMADSMDGAKRILNVTKTTGKNYSVMQNRRFLKDIRDMRCFIVDKNIGELGSIHADFFLGPHFGGFREVMENPLILDMAIHTFDQARYLIGAVPISVYCHEYNPPGSWYEGNASAICIFEMSNGEVFSYRGSWCSEGLGTSWESEWRITGSKGSIKWNGVDRPECEVIKHSEKKDLFNSVEKIEVPSKWNNSEEHFGCLEDMFESLEKGKKAETDSSDNIYSVAMVFGAIKSAKTGEKVYL